MIRYKVTVNPRYERISSFIKTLPQHFDEGGQVLHNGRNQVRLLEVDGQRVVVKRYKVPMWHQRIDYTLFRPSKAKRAYLYGMRLLEMQIDTPEPIAYIEEYSCGLFKVGYFISDYCSDANAGTLRSDEHPSPQLTFAIAQSLVSMHEKGFLHGDTNLSNFLYRKDDSPSGFHITTIDVNRSVFKQHASFSDCTKNLCRLTHVRPLLCLLVRQYAELRHWNPDETVHAVIAELDAFERKRALRKKFK